MILHVFLLLLLFVLVFSLTRLCSLHWPHHCPAQSAATRRTPIQRLLKPRSPHDCPACRLSCTPSSLVEPAPPAVRPWREVKSRRGAPKRLDTQGFACPNRQCPYFGITESQVHALVGDGTHGHAERIQTFRCQACRTTFSSRRHTPLYRLKTPSHQVAMVLTALAEGLDPSAGSPCLRLPSCHYHRLDVSSWRARTDLARALFLQPPAPAPPVRRTAHQAAQLQASALVVAGNRPLHKDSSRASSRPPHAKRGAESHPLPATALGRLSACRSSPVMACMCTFMRLPAHFGQWLEVGRRERKVRKWQVAEGLIYGQVKKSYRQRKLVRVTHVMRLGTGAALKIAGP